MNERTPPFTVMKAGKIIVETTGHDDKLYTITVDLGVLRVIEKYEQGKLEFDVELGATLSAEQSSGEP